MTGTSVLAFLLIFTVVSYVLGLSKARSLARSLGGVKHLESLPHYYGFLVAIWCGIPALLVFLLWQILEGFFVETALIASLPETARSLPADQLALLLDGIRNVAAGVITSTDPVQLEAADRLIDLQAQSLQRKTVAVLSLSIALGAFVLLRIRSKSRARTQVEKIVRYGLFACSLIAILTSFGILFSVLFEALRFFQSVPVLDFLFGVEWSPQTALRADQVGSSGSFGAVPLFLGTLQISAIALLIAVPVGLMSAIYLSEYASRKMRSVVKPILEMLAGIPTVVYGFFAALTVGPFIRTFAEGMGLSASSESALAAGLVMGVMIIPFVSSLTDDVISAVPSAMRDGALGLGSTQSEMILKVILPAALPGIVGGILLAASRAIGETMIVVMAAGLAANITANPLESVTTVTVQIVTLLVGDQEFDSPKTLAAFALGLMLFFVTLVLNVIALWVVKRFREQYD